MNKIRNVIIGYLSFALLAFVFIEVNNLVNSRQAYVEQRNRAPERKPDPPKREWVKDYSHKEKPSLREFVLCSPAEL